MPTERGGETAARMKRWMGVKVGSADRQVARLQLQVQNALQRVAETTPSSSSVQAEIRDAQQQLQADLLDITTVSQVPQRIHE